ncbi:DUF1194 domain-containing protein [Hwanghaeella grinnelliae]|uniref:DUF1194 domain-containing protein n=1 Tax=Hwanghaeella grinnelliae TaxID=2500179 RepID=UPI001386E175|nr:DUF1194 domain-containing protein [Hwanghaeella grinnelliae]
MGIAIEPPLNTASNPVMLSPTRRTFLASALAGAGSALLPRSAMALQVVDLQLILAIDCSYSVDQREYNLQVGAIGDALGQPEIRQAIGEGPSGSIALSLVQWSSEYSQIMALPWTLVTEGNAAAVGQRISKLPRMTADGATSMAAAVYTSMDYFNQSAYQSARRTIDISADGRNNNGPYMPQARDVATANGITINGLPILLEDPTLDYYFKHNVVGGPGSFVEKAIDYEDFRRAIRRKLLREIQFVPVALLDDPNGHYFR